MSLRPRYSLLTLLILTALVAGGVKLWYGPHWRTLSDPLTALDQALIAEHSPHSDFQKLLASEVKCKYLNTWTGTELLLIQGQPRANTPLSIEFAMWHELGPPPDVGTEYLELAIFSGTMPEQVLLRPREAIRSWYAPTFQPSPSFRKPLPILEPTRPVKYTVVPRQLPLCYFVSDRKRVYQTQAGSPYLLIMEIQVSDVPNPELRTLIEQELAQIPDHE